MPYFPESEPESVAGAGVEDGAVEGPAGKKRGGGGGATKRMKGRESSQLQGEHRVRSEVARIKVIQCVSAD